MRVRNTICQVAPRLIQAPLATAPWAYSGKRIERNASDVGRSTHSIDCSGIQWIPKLYLAKGRCSRSSRDPLSDLRQPHILANCKNQSDAPSSELPSSCIEGLLNANTEYDLPSGTAIDSSIPRYGPAGLLGKSENNCVGDGAQRCRI
jgi:hypothetical protein